jgi:hypothetical protein
MSLYNPNLTLSTVTTDLKSTRPYLNIVYYFLNKVKDPNVLKKIIDYLSMDYVPVITTALCYAPQLYTETYGCNCLKLIEGHQFVVDNYYRSQHTEECGKHTYQEVFWCDNCEAVDSYREYRDLPEDSLLTLRDTLLGVSMDGVAKCIKCFTTTEKSSGLIEVVLPNGKSCRYFYDDGLSFSYTLYLVRRLKKIKNQEISMFTKRLNFLKENRRNL